MKVRTRFAPSPTGFMHIGNLRTALYAYLFAKHNDGDFILRIEDTDQERYVEGAVDLIYSTLKKAGIEHDEGPDKDKGFGPYVQSERKPLYKEYAEKLVELGGAYYCFCSKERLDSLADENGVRKYDKHCLHLSKEEVQKKLAAGEPYVIRQNIPPEGQSSYEDMVYGRITVDFEDLEDQILLKSDGMPTYNFANVVDDHLMGITHVIRGTEYLSSTPKYNLMYDAFGWERPQYMHLPPIMKDQTRKLSKRYGDANFEDFLKKGFLPEAIVNYIALLGWSPKNNTEKMTMQELIDSFNVEGINKSASIFDEVKMRWLNGQYIRELSDEKFDELAFPYFEQSKVKGLYDYKKLGRILKGRVETFGDIPEAVSFLAEYGEFDTKLFENKKSKSDESTAKICLEAALSVVNDIKEWNNDSLFEAFGGLCEGLGVKKNTMFWAIRVAISGRDVTPGGATELADVLGRKETEKRMKFAISLLNKA
ncbi:MAG: glutamate--tRNA ligase [Faecalibacterium sp.]|nr:glutamate--tRNA ligase [Faecalibacterium sp.]MDD7571273.1 glutamate--tRNA ligase [Faecalibacterium sp.]